jgi:hypothetical protein
MGSSENEFNSLTQRMKAEAKEAMDRFALLICPPTCPLNLVVDAVVTCKTVYTDDVIVQPWAESRTMKEDGIAQLSPARYKHINP